MRPETRLTACGVAVAVSPNEVMVSHRARKNITHCVGITLIDAAKYNAKKGVCDLYGLSSVRGQCVRAYLAQAS